MRLTEDQIDGFVNTLMLYLNGPRLISPENAANLSHHQMKRSLVTSLLLLALVCPAAAQSPAEKVSSYRAEHREGRVTSDSILTRLAREQAEAMAGKDDLDHNAAGDFSRRIAPSGAGNAVENIAYGNTTFDKTLDQWIKSPPHRKNLLLRNATRMGVANARSTKTGRTYWAMVIAGGYEKPLPANARQPVAKRQSSPTEKPQEQRRLPRQQAGKCTINLLGLCL